MIIVMCEECGKQVVPSRIGDGLYRYRCPCCGTKMVKQIFTKYHYIKDVRRPR